jgi:hypothetical protein
MWHLQLPTSHPHVHVFFFSKEQQNYEFCSIMNFLLVVTDLPRFAMYVASQHEQFYASFDFFMKIMLLEAWEAGNYYPVCSYL